IVVTPNTKTGFHLGDKSPRIPTRFLKNLTDVVEKLGGIVCSDASCTADIVVVGTADEAVLESKEFLRLIELKASGGEFALLKDGSFVKGLIARGFVRAL
ncbi:MAG: hypothetical protein ACI3XC_10780, partial [Phascolarctobacterium sp.]